MNIYDLLAALSCIFVIAFLCDFYVVRAPWVGVDLGEGDFTAIMTTTPEWRKVDEVWDSSWYRKEQEEFRKTEARVYSFLESGITEKERNEVPQALRNLPYPKMHNMETGRKPMHQGKRGVVNTRAQAHGVRVGRQSTEAYKLWVAHGKPVRPLILRMLDGCTDVAPEWRRTFIDALKQVIGEGRV